MSHICDCGYVIHGSDMISLELTPQQADKLLEIISQWNSEYAWGRDTEANSIEVLVQRKVNKEEESKESSNKEMLSRKAG